MIRRGKPLLNCSICNEPVTLETTKTDEAGKAVHEECYVLRLSKQAAQDASPRKPPNSAPSTC
jgi:hypothetical protein